MQVIPDSPACMRSENAVPPSHLPAPLHPTPPPQLLNSVDLMYSYLKRSCCNAQCEARLAALTTLHARGMHFKEPSAAMDTARLIIRLREMYLAVREEATKEGRRAQHEEVPPSWDNHKKCY